jgi:hypothetical protein
MTLSIGSCEFWLKQNILFWSLKKQNEFIQTKSEGLRKLLLNTFTKFKQILQNFTKFNDSDEISKKLTQFNKNSWHNTSI